MNISLTAFVRVRRLSQVLEDQAPFLLPISRTKTPETPPTRLGPIEGLGFGHIQVQRQRRLHALPLGCGQADLAVLGASEASASAAVSVCEAVWGLDPKVPCDHGTIGWRKPRNKRMRWSNMGKTKPMVIWGQEY